MTCSRLNNLYDAAMRRENKTKIAAKPAETEEEHNRRVLLEAMQKQKQEDMRNAGMHTRYVENSNG